ncbi:MAG: hypothetical protein QOJ73_178 [Streptosporangiaceae bacterium]|jgi:tetratricopeptide (TPR) repeat protein|nr:hypothetical protein [Streptosporangiaceae bacterium]
MSASSVNAPQTPGRSPEIWGKIPQRNKNFTGRDGLLDRLHTGIAAEVTAVVPHALHGLGGVGKTQVAIEYAYRFRDEYELVWWISADQPVLLRSSLAALAPHLGVPSAAAIGIEDCANAVIEALQHGEPYGRWLLIFDNADRPEDLQGLLPKEAGHILITSRNRAWQTVVETVAVDVFTRAESVAFLKKRVPREISDDDADRLAQELGDLPLALEQAGALQAETGMPIGEYLRLLKEHATLLLGEGRQSEYPVSMTAAWSLSVSQLKESLPEAVELVQCCAFFGPEPIPLDVFVPVGDQIGAEPLTAVDLRLRALLSNPIMLNRAFKQLGRYALARLDDWNRTIQLHRLVQALLRDELKAEEQERIRHEVHLLLATAVMTRDPDDNRHWDRYLELLAHAEPSRVTTCPDPVVRKFCLDVVRYLYSSGDYGTGRSFVERLIKDWEKSPVRDIRDILVAKRHLGIVLRELGEYPDTYELNRETLDQMIERLGPEDRETLLLSNSHGADLRARGEFRAARDHDQDSLQRHRHIFGPHNRATLRCMNNLAVDYCLMSDYETARQMYEETFQLQHLPDSKVNPQEVLIVRDGLARIVRLSGAYADASDWGEDALAYGRANLGAAHPWTLRTAKSLSIAKRRTGAVAEGLDLARDIYSQENRMFGPDHPDTLAAAMNLANALRNKDLVNEGFDLAVETLARYPRIYGHEHPYNRGCGVNMALLLRVRGDPQAAWELNTSSLAGLDERLGRDHDYSLTCALNLASDLAELGDTQGARELGEDTLARLAELFGENHPVTLAAAANLVFDLRAEGAGEQAERLSQATLDGYARALGFGHPDVQAFLAGRRIDFDFDPPPI